ncbi:MAG: hypothetical protein ACRDIE_24540, partial [Chloroflexota bacterium]
MASLPDRRPPPVYVVDPSPLGSAGPAPPPLRGFQVVAAWPLWRYAFIAIGLGALCGTAAMYLISLTNYLSVDGDNAVYITLAKALATGHGYTDIQGPTPRIEAQYPFLFPLFLTPIVWIWGTGAVLLMELLVTAFALAALVWCFFLFRRRLDSAPLAFVVTVAAGSSELLWEYSHKVLTEVPYMFFTVAACWFADIYAKEDSPYTKAGLLAVLAAAAAFLTRTIGLSLCLALPIYVLFASPIPRTGAAWRKRAAKVVVIGAVLVVTAGAWTLRNRMVFSGEGHNYIGQFLLKQAYVPEAGQVITGELWSRMDGNI